ncbi:hypothetical protein FQR65_LT06960 [Abscondita terminalis]|nr:hypothetical protein FQR65_LT06960 [Abscondita terminalis]
MRLIKFTICQLLVFICYNIVIASMDTTVKESNTKLQNKQPVMENSLENDFAEILNELNVISSNSTDESLSSNVPKDKEKLDTNRTVTGNSLEDDFSEILKELNIIPSTETPVTVAKDKWNITSDFPSNTDIEKFYSTSTPKTSIQQPPNIYPDNGVLLQPPTWVTISEDSPVNDDNVGEPPLIPQSGYPTYPTNNGHKDSRNNATTNSVDKSIIHKKIHSSNYFSSHQSHEIETIVNHKTPLPKSPPSIPQTYLPIPFVHPQNPYSWMQPHCPCQNYYNPFSIQPQDYSDQTKQHNGLKYKSEIVQQYNHRNSYHNVNNF